MDIPLGDQYMLGTHKSALYQPFRNGRPKVPPTYDGDLLVHKKAFFFR
jgi:hypothetical protein